MEIMYALEPIHYKANSIIFNELEDINEIIFFVKGYHEIGYELNNENIFVLRYGNSNPIGAFGITFDVKSEYVYKCKTDCNGYFIRRNNWKIIINNSNRVTDHMKGHIYERYEIKIRSKMNAAKRAALREVEHRSTNKYKFVFTMDAITPENDKFYTRTDGEK